MQNKIISEFEKRTFKGTKKIPAFRSGDTIRVDYKIPEGSDKGKFRIQAFEGVCIRVKRGTVDASFTVRKIGASGVGVERIFPTASPFIDKIVVKARGIVRRSRLYYLRDLSGKSARIRSRFGDLVAANAMNDEPAEAEATAPAAAATTPSKS